MRVGYWGLADGAGRDLDLRRDPIGGV
jgi:hypothetical protein